MGAIIIDDYIHFLRDIDNEINATPDYEFDKEEWLEHVIDCLS